MPPRITMSKSPMVPSSRASGRYARDPAHEDLDHPMERGAQLPARVVELQLEEPVDAGQEDRDQIAGRDVTANLPPGLRGGEECRQQLDEHARLAAQLGGVSGDHGEELVPQARILAERVLHHEID